MHKITISINGAVNDSACVDFSDGEALPMYSKLKGILSPGSAAGAATGSAPRGRRRSRDIVPEGAESELVNHDVTTEDL